LALITVLNKYLPLKKEYYNKFIPNTLVYIGKQSLEVYAFGTLICSIAFIHFQLINDSILIYTLYVLLGIIFTYYFSITVFWIKTKPWQIKQF
jgi:hypothetical protein